jgi:putative redox protein
MNKFVPQTTTPMTSTVTYEGELRTKAEHLQSGSAIETDAPLDNQGKAERFSPTDLVATALGSCMMTIMGIKARDMAVDLRGLKIDIEKHMAADPRRISGIDVTLHFPAGLTLEDKQRIILERAALTCPVFQSIHPDIVVDTKFVY